MAQSAEKNEEVFQRLSEVAKQHSKECGSVTKNMPMEGWLCNKCDSDFDEWQVEGSVYFEEERD